MKDSMSYLKCTCSHLGLCIFVMFGTFREEMQYIFLEKNLIFMDFLVAKVAATEAKKKPLEARRQET